MTAPTGPSDPGLAGERTTLAWSRIGLSLLALPSAIMVYATGSSWLAVLASAFAAVLGLVVLTISLRRQRAAPGMLQSRSLRLPADQVILSGACVLLLSVSCLLLVAV